MKLPAARNIMQAIGMGSAILLVAILGCVQPIARPGQTFPIVNPPTPTAVASPIPPSSPTPAPTAPVTPAPTSPRPTPTSTPTVLPLLEVRGPEDGSTVRGKAVRVHGLASLGSAISINGVPAQVDGEGRFAVELSLPNGPNEIRVAAVDSLGNFKSQIVHITLEPPQPFFLFVTEPAAQSVVSVRSIRLAGRTGLGALVSVNGASIGVDAQGAFATTLTLEPGPNIIDVLSTSPEGQVLSIVLAIIYRA